jgi:hypothetical protein
MAFSESDVRPRITGQDTGHLRRIDAKSVGEVALGYATPLPPVTDGAHVRFRESRAVMPFAKAMAPLGGLVRHVVGVRPKEQMSGVDTSANVAPMEDGHPLGDRSVVQLPRHPVRGQPTGGFRAPNLPVSVAADAAGPKPTAIGLADLGPKPIGQGLTVGVLECVGTRPTTKHPLALQQGDEGRSALKTRALGPLDRLARIRTRARAKACPAPSDLAWLRKERCAAVLALAGDLGTLGTRHGLTSLIGRSVVPCPRPLQRRGGFRVPELSHIRVSVWSNVLV